MANINIAAATEKLPVKGYLDIEISPELDLFLEIEKLKTEKNAVILGVSVDNVDSHKSFCAKEGINFKRLADSSHAVVEQYGSIMEHNGRTLAARNTFLIDPTGVIRKVYLKVGPQGHSEEVLADLEQLQSVKRGFSAKG